MAPQSTVVPVLCAQRCTRAVGEPWRVAKSLRSRDLRDGGSGLNDRCHPAALLLRSNRLTTLWAHAARVAGKIVIAVVAMPRPACWATQPEIRRWACDEDE